MPLRDFIMRWVREPGVYRTSSASRRRVGDTDDASVPMADDVTTSSRPLANDDWRSEIIPIETAWPTPIDGEVSSTMTVGIIGADGETPDDGRGARNALPIINDHERVATRMVSK